jgi:hypothetical protein
METNRGRITVTALKDEEEESLPPRFDIICTMTRPTTSSSIAAAVVTVPSRVVISCVVDKMVNVVPRLVADRAAPAAKAWRGLADTKSLSTNDSPMGTLIPVRATDREM